MRILFSALAAVVLMGTPAVAGEWTGAYVGLGLGHADVGGPGVLDGDGFAYGIHAGYDYDFGDFVLGGEFEYDRTDVDLLGGVAAVDNIARLKLRLGYDFGEALGYVVIGGARADTSVGNDSGAVYGLGFAVPMGDQFTVGGEILRHDFNNFNNSGSDVDATTINVRASFRF